MAAQRYTVEIQPDFLEKQSKAAPLQALAEFIWNSLDADADAIDVALEQSDLHIDGIIIRDNGHAFAREEAPTLFGQLGGSWKRLGTRTKGKGRALHGRDGRGRFKAFALGRVADWTVTFRRDGRLFSFPITIIADNLREVVIGDELPAKSKHTGVEVTISEIDRHFRSLVRDGVDQDLAEIFAPYMLNYRDVTISFQSIKIDPDPAIRTRKPFPLADIVVDGETFSADLEIIEWRQTTKRSLYICNRDGFALLPVQTRFHVGDFNFSAYLRSSYVDLLQVEDRLGLAEMDVPLAKAIHEAQGTIKAYFRERAAQKALNTVDQWKEEKIYPYPLPPSTPLEVAQRQVFDIVAVNVSDYLTDFDQAPPRQKAFQLRMLRHAIEKSPEEVQLIIREVLDLPERKQQELADLLREVPLVSIISASKVIADRLRFIEGLHTILFNPDIKKVLRERTQLHKMLEDHTWLFGEEFNISASDQNLTVVLQEHLRRAGRTDVVVDRPVRKIDGRKGIVDLMFSRIIKRNKDDELEHLIVELKAPSVRIGADEVVQTIGYATAIQEDARFREVPTKWHFWLLSNDMDRLAQGMAHQGDRPTGIVHQSPDRMVTVWAKTWAQILLENRSRMRFFQDQLQREANVGDALRHLRARYQAVIEGTRTEGAIETVLAEAEENEAAP